MTPWDKDRNIQLFTRLNLEAAKVLLNLNSAPVLVREKINNHIEVMM